MLYSAYRRLAYPVGLPGSVAIEFGYRVLVSLSPLSFQGGEGLNWLHYNTGVNRTFVLAAKGFIGSFHLAEGKSLPQQVGRATFGCILGLPYLARQLGQSHQV